MAIVLSLAPITIGLVLYAALFKLGARVLRYQDLRWSSCFQFVAMVIVASVVVRLIETTLLLSANRMWFGAMGMVVVGILGGHFFSTRATKGTQAIGFRGGLLLTGVSMGIALATGAALFAISQFALTRNGN